MAQPYPPPYPYGGPAPPPGAPADPAYYGAYQQQQAYGGYPQQQSGYPPGSYAPGAEYTYEQQQAYWYGQQQQPQPPGAAPPPGEPQPPVPPGGPAPPPQPPPGAYGGSYYGQQGGYPGYDQGYGGWGQPQQQHYAAAPYPPVPPQQQQPPTPQPPPEQQPPLPPEPQVPQQQNAPRAPTTTAAGATPQRGGAPLNYSAVPPPASLAPRPRAPPMAIKPAGSLAPTSTAGASSTAAAGVAADAVARMRAAAQAKAAELAATARKAAKQSPAAAAPRIVPGAPLAAAAAAAAASAAAPKGLPAALSAWVQRCLEVYKSPQDKAWIKDHLKEYMIQVRAAGTLWTTDWDRHAIPRPPWAAAAGQGASATPTGSKRNWGGLFADSSSDDDARGYGGGGRGGGRAGKKLSKKQKKQHAARGGADAYWSAEEERKRAQRAGRFDLSAGAPGDFTDRVEYMRHKKRLVELAAEANGDDIDWDRFKIVGTCLRLEKSYLRLTSAPDPAEVRPPAVLRRALDRLLGLVATGEGGGYFYYNDQFKAMRQDLTVQGIRDGLAVEVYEAHARAALEYGDHAEYNQCQAQLALLYAAGQPGACAEFAAYRLLYQAVHSRHGEGRKLGATLRQVLEDQVGTVSTAPEVAHALAVRAAIAARAYARFFELYASAPGLGRALMDVHAPAMRWHALNTLARAYRPAVPLATLAAGAGFSPRAPRSEPELWEQQQKEKKQKPDAGGTKGKEGRPLPGRRTLEFVGEHAAEADEAMGLAAAGEWALSCGAVLTDGPGGECLLDAKACCGRGVLHPPPEKDKVAHGDANLDINDFLAKIGV